MMNSPKLVIPAALLLAGIAGFIAGRTSSQGPPAPQGAETSGPVNTRASRANQAGNADKTGARGDRRGEDGKAMPAGRMRARLEAIMRGEVPLERSQELLAFINQLGPDDFQEAVDYFRSLGLTESRLGEYSLLLSAWAKVDPMAALTYARENTGNRFATDTILTTWASLDPYAAIRWADTNHTGDEANPHMVGVIRGIASTDPDLATRLLTEMPRSRERGAALDAMLPHMLGMGNDAARKWIEGLGDDSLRNGAMLRVAERFAQSDPVGTVAWLMENPGEATQRRMDDVYRVWMRDNPQAAESSFAVLPPGENRSNALRGLVSAVSSSDPAAGISLMDRHAADLNDNVVRYFAWHSFNTDPAAAASQISRIQDARQQDQMYRRILERWLRDDLEAASMWIRSNPLPEAVQQHAANIQQQVERRAAARP